MRDVTTDFLHLATGSNLRCVWARVLDGGRERLVSIWMDSASAKFKTTSRHDVRNRSRCHALWDASGE